MRLILAFLLTIPVWALSNSVTISTETEVSATQVHRVPRWFAQGEIASYPQPFVANAAAAAWQVDVKNRWPDGTVRFAIVHFQAAIPANGSITVDFRNSANACHLGNAATCAAAGLDGAGMLAWGGGTWDAEIEASADPIGATTTRTANARTMLTAGHFTYWLRGPLVTAVIAEDASASRTYDFGWSGAGCTAPYSDCTWANDTTFRSLHPLFVLTFNTGSSAVRVEYSVANYWTTARQDQRYSVVLKNSSGTVLSKTGIYGVFGTWWRKEFWDGSAPVTTTTDFNLPYLRHSKMVPPFRQGVTVTEANVPAQGTHSLTYSVTWFNNGLDANYPFFCTPGRGTCGSRLTWYPATGGRPDRGFYPLWEAHWLFSMRRNLFDVVTGNADFLGTQYTHHRESGTGLPNYHGTTAALGLPVSINARTTYNAVAGGTGGLPAAVGPVSTTQSTWRGWSIDAHHRHSHAQLAYLITGDWWYMQEQSFLAHIIWGWGDPSYGTVGYNWTWNRRSPWGEINPDGTNHRSLAWQTWNVWRASLIAPDDDPQSAYLKEKFRDHLAIFEGYYDVRDGDFYQPCTTNPYDPPNDTSKWCHGRNMVAKGWEARNHNTPLRGDSTASPPIDTFSSPWMQQFIRLVFFDICRTEGIGCGIARYHAEGVRLGTTEPGANPTVLHAYTSPMTWDAETTLSAGIGQNDTLIPVTNGAACPDPAPTQVRINNEWVWIVAKNGNTWTAGSTTRGGRGYGSTSRSSHLAGTTVHCPRQATNWAEYTSATSDKTNVMVPHTDNVGDMSYNTYACATGRWSEDFIRSARPSQIWDANCHDTGTDGALSMYSNFSDPRWLVEPDRQIPRLRVSVTGTTAVLRYLAPSGAACRVHVGASAPTTSDDSTDPVDAQNGRMHSFTATGLSAGTVHYRITCGTVRKSGTFTVQ